MPPNYHCDCGSKCLNHNPQNCNFLQDYRTHLDELDFDYIISELNRIANKIQEIEQFETEPVIVLIVYETPQNPCSERKPLQDWFMAHGIELREWQLPK
jgi:hypothetical protein